MGNRDEEIKPVDEIRNIIFGFNNCDSDMQEKSQKQLAMELILADKLAKAILDGLSKQGGKA